MSELLFGNGAPAGAKAIPAEFARFPRANGSFTCASPARAQGVRRAGRHARLMVAQKRVSSASMEADFFKDEAKRKTVERVKTVEAQTSAELVVAVRRRSGEYRTAAYHFGFALAALVVLYLLVVPTLYSIGAIALDGLLALVFGVVLASNWDALLRALARRRTLDDNVERAAKALFFDAGISRTRGRNGILVYVSTFEQRVCVLADVGIALDTKADPWNGVCANLNSAIKKRNVVEFLSVLETMGGILAKLMPASADDMNELADEVR